LSAAASATALVSEPPRPERRDAARVVDALESGDDGDRAVGEAARELLVHDPADARAHVGAVGLDPDLMAHERPAADAHALEHDRGERAGDLLAGRDERVHLALARRRRRALAERDQPVRLARHRAHDHDDVVPLRPRARHASRDVPQPIEIGHGRPAVLLNDQSHVQSCVVRKWKGPGQPRLVAPAVCREADRPALALAVRQDDAQGVVRAGREEPIEPLDGRDSRAVEHLAQK
jgi:hypothetical protein